MKNKRYSWTRPLTINIVLLIVLMLAIICAILLSYFYGKSIDNDFFCAILGTFLGVLAALLFDRIIENFKFVRKYKDWIQLLVKELTPIKNISINSTVHYDCLHNLINSPDLAIFIKKQDLLILIYDLHIDLETFASGSNINNNLIISIKDKVTSILNYIS